MSPARERHTPEPFPHGRAHGRFRGTASQELRPGQDSSPARQPRLRRNGSSDCFGQAAQPVNSRFASSTSQTGHVKISPLTPYQDLMAWIFTLNSSFFLLSVPLSVETEALGGSYSASFAPGKWVISSPFRGLSLSPPPVSHLNHLSEGAVGQRYGVCEDRELDSVRYAICGDVIPSL
ncbi:hypothetical protein SAMN05660836_01645 [Thermodesulforhabdus norvegica]|uniref:Uncharacterized protein n=1 Tax=Thermodesulforhabdus norvegica TaxID=39841 RepID=A0A1I4U5F1_9BACT|nr:hypothetical protein SAMN05660836_01645 [Thermodesulforhabdus norvegica]